MKIHITLDNGSECEVEGKFLVDCLNTLLRECELMDDNHEVAIVGLAENYVLGKMG